MVGHRQLIRGQESYRPNHEAAHNASEAFSEDERVNALGLGSPEVALLGGLYEHPVHTLWVQFFELRQLRDRDDGRIGLVLRDRKVRQTVRCESLMRSCAVVDFPMALPESVLRLVFEVAPNLDSIAA